VKRSRTTAGLVATIIAVVVLPPSISGAASSCMGRTATIEGTAADDQLIGTSANDVIVGGGGDDVISGSDGNDVICGGKGNDALFGEAGSDVVRGDAGSDQISGGAGDDVMVGGKGLDFVNYYPSPVPVEVDLGAGHASGEGSDDLSGFENIFGSLFADDLVGSNASNTIQALDGDDRVDGAGGIDLIYDGVAPGSQGTDGNDQIDGGSGLDGILFTSSPGPVDVDLADGTATGNGTDVIGGIEGVFGSPFADVLEGDSQRNLFLGVGGDDTIDGREGDDAVAYWLASGPVTADLAAGEGSASGEGTDTFNNVEGLLGSVGFGDDLSGDAGDNLLDGDGGNDKLSGLDGNDWLVGGSGNDTIDGGEGTYDLVDHSNTAFLEVVAAVTVDLAAGTARGQGNDSIADVEAVKGSSLNDEIRGDGSVNLLFGEGGDDEIFGGGGNDFIDGGPGPDRADGQAGTDNCVDAKRRTSCERDRRAEDHPVLDEASAIEGWRRNFRRNF
jgi:Ca2+-binding RTX toxin-like protein